MVYKEQIEQAKRAAAKWREKHPIVGVGELRVDSMVDDLTRSITDLLTRAETAEADNARMREAMKPNCLLCDSMHQDNGNCTAVGGFCTAVPAAHCPLIPRLMEDNGRLKDLLKEAEARAEKAEMERDKVQARHCSEEPCTTCTHYEKQDCDGDCLSCSAACPCNQCNEYSMWAWNGRTEKKP